MMQKKLQNFQRQTNNKICIVEVKQMKKKSSLSFQDVLILNIILFGCPQRSYKMIRQYLNTININRVHVIKIHEMLKPFDCLYNSLFLIPHYFGTEQLEYYYRFRCFNTISNIIHKLK